MEKQLVSSVTEARLEAMSNNCQRYYGMECGRGGGKVRGRAGVKHGARSSETVEREGEQGNRATDQSNSAYQMKFK
ncbi:hypothetical protein E2C01_089263 [Portunus trituberculatus]|uniref:Uncharacterized protein n=1 Tax=Portunus trituberculatus TaxID=210409 RepID=A0A5B7J8C0_PORTR|nr:hypothetical protein [Portunus trituberculatus]